MAYNKAYVLSTHYKLPFLSCKSSKENSNIIICNDSQFYVFSENYGLRKDSYRWVIANSWRFPMEFIAKHSINLHQSFNGITSEEVIEKLRLLQADLGEKFNEVSLALIQNKTAFYEDAVKEFGYSYFWKPIDGQEVIKDGFRIYRIK